MSFVNVFTQTHPSGQIQRRGIWAVASLENALDGRSAKGARLVVNWLRLQRCDMLIDKIFEIGACREPQG